MSQAEELLDSLDETIPTHQHVVIDSDSYFIIDPITRAVENTSGSKNLLMQYDHASERYTFELPRYVEGHDMSLCTAVKVHYNNIESGTLIENADVNDLDDLHVDPTDANKVICSWLIKRQATQLVGSLNFLVQYLCATSDGTITYEWHSDIYKNIEIREGRNNGPAAVSDYTDILEQWRAKLSGADVLKKDNTEEYTPTEDYHPATKKYVDEQISSAVSGWLDEHPEVTITVQDGSITEQKLAPELVDKLMFGDVEPAYDDIPKVFFGDALPQTKTEIIMPFVYISKTKVIRGYVKIKAQGNSSLSYAKKNETAKMYEDEACETKLKIDFKGWGKQSKHVYKANWIDLTHARNVVSARIWADVVKSRADYMALPELLRTSPNQGAVDGFPVKVYSQGIYQGRYTLNIPKDAWMANMDDSLDEHCILCGEGYNSGCFREASMSQWTDEVHDSRPSLITNRWLEIINFVMNSTDEEFKTNLENYFFVDSLIDYFIYGMVSCGLDAFGKNQLYFTYDGVKWIASMYDMDSTWGLYWNGSKFVSASYSREEFEDYVSQQATGEGNLLYVRLVNLFHEEIKTRYEELKNGVLSIPNIINHFERFTDIAPLDLVKEDYASTTGSGIFTGIPSKDTNNIQQLRQFIIDRYAYCDEYFANLTPEVPVPCTGITLDKTALTFTDSTAQTITATVEPFNTTDKIVWTSSKNDVATVGNGVVTPVSNGSCTITATCGNVSATCNVTVNVEEEIVTYTITRNLTNCTSSSAVTSINEGSAHTETITPDSGYTLEGVTVTVSMGGVDISSSFVDGVLTIASVTGNVVISVSAVEEAEEPVIPENATVLTKNYSPNGESFILYNGEFDLNTQKIVASINLDGCIKNNEMLLSIGETEDDIGAWGGKQNLHLVNNVGPTYFLNLAINGLNSSSNGSLPDMHFYNKGTIVFEFSANGVTVNGNNYPHTNMETFLENVKAFTNIVIGSTQGTTRSMATYNYVYIVTI